MHRRLWGGFSGGCRDLQGGFSGLWAESGKREKIFPFWVMFGGRCCKFVHSGKILRCKDSDLEVSGGGWPGGGMRVATMEGAADS